MSTEFTPDLTQSDMIDGGEFGSLRDPIILTPRLPEGPIDLDNPIIRTVNTIWDETNFAIPREPLVIGTIQDRARFEEVRPGVEKVSWLPIKMPGTDYRLPPEYGQFQEVLEDMAGFEHAINDEVDDTYAYLTVDVGPVTAGESHRKKGAHTDGFQSILIVPKTKASHFYSACSNVPTTYHPQPFDTSALDPGRDNYFWAFDRMVDPQKTSKVNPFDMVLMDAYTVHQSSVSDEDIARRVFLRLSYEYRPFTRNGCGKNPYFDYNWETVPCRCQVPPLVFLK